MEHNLVFYNKEGYRINTEIDSDGIEYSSMYFDKNSTNTFKTQCIYTFDQINGSNNTYTNVNLDAYQLFNEQGIFIYPSEQKTFTIKKIINTINNSTYKSKWLIIDNIHKYTTPGMYINIKNLSIDSSFNEFDINGSLNVFQIKAVNKDKILIQTIVDNDNATVNALINTYNNTLSNTASITLLNCIEYTYNNTTTISDNPIFNTNTKRISLISNDVNEGTYTIKSKPQLKNKYYYKLPENITGVTPAINDYLELKFNFFTDNIIINYGVTDFISGTNEILLPFIPKFLKVGDLINAIETDTPLFTNNDNVLTITNIDHNTNIITVSGAALSNQTVECKLVLVSNEFKIKQDIVLDNNGQYSLPVTYSSIISNYQETLYSTDNLIDLVYLEDSNELLIECDLIDNNFELEFRYNNNIIPIVKQTKNVYPLITDEKLKEYSYIEPNSSHYNRHIEFISSGTFISININGKEYLQNGPDIQTILTDWVNTYSSELSDLFIDVLVSGSDPNVLIIKSQYPNVPVFIDIKNAEYFVHYYEYEINTIKNSLSIIINGQVYTEQFDTDIVTTIDNWTDTYYYVLEQLGIIVSYDNINNKLLIGSLFIDSNLDIQFNLGYIPKNGDYSIIKVTYKTDYSYDLISGNNITITGHNLLNIYNIGQTFTISGSNYPLINNTYTIIELEHDYITLSYQGPFKSDPGIDIVIDSSEFIQHPKFGLSVNNKKGKYIWSWKSTISRDFFLYDFSGDQLKPYTNGFPDYNGIKPLCGINGEIPLRLISEPNMNINEISNPLKQQTVFNTITHTLPYIDEVTVDNILPEPMSIYVGYNSKFEMWNKARLYLDFIEDISYDIITSKSGSTFFDEVIFNSNYIEIQNPTGTYSFDINTFRPGQLISITLKDITNDNIHNIIDNNKDLVLKIKTVEQYKLTFENTVNQNSSVQSVAKTTYPTHNNMGNQIMINRYCSVTINVLPKTVAYFDFYGESEDEEERYKIHLNNINKDVLSMKDFFIFKETDINEEGIDWIFLNRKRKEMLEIYSEIFNHVSSYKAIIKAINFFGYNDLTFNEYFQNINPESKKFGQVFNLELLNILDKNTKNIKYDNLAFNSLRNSGYIKTNVFSLGYKATDEFGNFISGYSLKEVQIKLLGLKRWLHNNVVPLGAKIADINTKYKMQSNFVLNHETYMNKNFRVEEYSYGISFKPNIFKNIVTNGNNTYDISIEFITTLTDNEPLFFSYDIKTFNVEIWNNVNYNPHSYVLYQGKYFTNGPAPTTAGEAPIISDIWHEVTLSEIPVIQHIANTKTDLSNVSFTITELLDPMFSVTVYYHSGYANTYAYTRTYHIKIYNQPATII